jgi:hypothetical protein
MGLNIVPHQRLYWSTQDDEDSTHRPIRQSMSLIRWEQIHQYFHIWDPATSERERVHLHDKVEPIAQNLRQNFKRYWHADTHVTVDECIQGFTGRIPDIVNIPSKPTPIGLKIWCLAQSGYLLDCLFHRRGDKKDEGP